jgi:hypothetical protein
MATERQPGEGYEESLRRLGMRAEHFVEALGASNIERRLCRSRHAAKSAAGYYAYNGMLTSLSSQMCTDNSWTRENPMSMPLLVNRARRTVLTVSSGDRYTGLIGTGKKPHSKNPKGELTGELTRLNETFDDSAALFSVEKPPIHRLLAELVEFTFWVALVHFDKKKTEVRCEISQPKFINARGRLADYHFRIPIPPYSLADEDFNDDEDPNEGFGLVDFDVPRR